MGFPLIALGITAAGSLLQAGLTSYAGNQQMKAENAQLKMDMENERIAALSEQNKRQEEFLRLASANEVAVAASGVSNFSYQQGIAPYNKEVAGRDIQTIGFNSRMRTDRMRYQIGVNRAGARTQTVAAFGTAAADIAGAGVGYLSRPGGLLNRSISPSQ